MALRYNLNEFDYKKQTRILKSAENDDTRVLSFNNYDTLLTSCFEEKTLYEVFLRGLRISSKMIKNFRKFDIIIKILNLIF